ncbi:MAG: hypothetical protein J2P37_29080 [Ktedonobacteraceae bacterium]|nr:hypothetical protein [Ktedonobacteraceae bacterium]MBO0789445.1 hypothetical protein [Ktedonobacteraceae bacterium]
MKHHTSLYLLGALCGILLLLTACSQNSSSGSVLNSAAGTSTVRTPTHASTTPTTASTAATKVAFTQYKGDGYTINYPKNWKVTKGVNAVTFNDPNSIANFVVQIAPNPKGTIKPDKPVSTVLNSVQKGGKNYKKLNLPATTTINGVTWTQAGATADISAQGKTQSEKMVTLATNHEVPGRETTLFSIVYASSTQNFDRDDRSIFHPMLQSFKFV